eukprot:TRINITY_DN878_c0_g1_i1.p1 TRINITY_DN878_c0_g1~~TRINITY_DN878_c0_g1_i1.p1  ORF type:complete len:334 (-),score=73.20 TRINITY_DN878_c0_g1_i1:92-1093(-)
MKYYYDSYSFDLFEKDPSIIDAENEEINDETNNNQKSMLLEAPNFIADFSTLRYGTFGTVVKIINPETQNIFALKRLHHVCPTSKLLHEAYILDKLKNNNNIVQFYGVVQHNNLSICSLILGWVDYIKFKVFIKSCSLDDIIQYLKYLLIAIKNCHANNVIHNDIKPSNFLFNIKEPHKSCLIDFGLATFQENFFPHEGLGTVGFRSPERILNIVASDKKNDIWAIGIILWSLLLGIQRIFDSDNILNVCQLIGIQECKKWFPQLKRSLKQLEKDGITDINVEEMVKDNCNEKIHENPEKLRDLIELARKLTHPLAKERLDARKALKLLGKIK